MRAKDLDKLGGLAMSWKKFTSEHRPKGWAEHTRPALLAGPGYVSTVSIGQTRNWNGSGPDAFGGVESWPCVDLNFGLPTGREDLQKLLVEDLKAFVDSFLEKHKLGGP